MKQDYDIDYYYINNVYFITFSNYDSQNDKYDIYYTTYSPTSGFSSNCPPPDFCKIENAKYPKVSIKTDPVPVEYGIVWEDSGNSSICLPQIHEVYLRILDNELNLLSPLYEKIDISNPSDEHGAHFPNIFWYEAGKRWVISWLEDTCIRNPDGLNFEAIWQRSMNRNVPIGVIDLSEPSSLTRDILGVISNIWGVGWGFDGERSFFSWVDGRVDPRTWSKEIFANHSFLAHPYSFVPERDEKVLSNPLVGCNDIQSTSDGNYFISSYINNDGNNGHLEFSLLDENLSIVNGKDKIQADINGGVKFHKILWNKNNDEYLTVWYQSIPQIERQSEGTLPIPDNDLNGVLSEIYVSEDLIISKIEITLSITHPEDGDLTISLIGPNSQEIVLSQKNGAGGADYFWTTFSDDGSMPISSGSPPFSGTFIPEQPLSTFNGLSSQGFWDLKVVDDTAGNAGVLHPWQIKFYFSSSDGFFIRNISSEGEIFEEPVNILNTEGESIEKFKSSLNDTGDILGLFYKNNSNQLKFFSHPNGTPFLIDSNSEGFKDLDISYNNLQGYEGWGLLWSINLGEVYFAVVDRTGNFIVEPFLIGFSQQPSEVALIWDGTHYQVYYTLDYLIFRAYILDPDGTIVSGPLEFSNYGNVQLDAFFTGTETVVYWVAQKDDEAIYSFKILDSKGYPKTDNIDIYSKNLSMSLGNLFAMSANHSKIFSAYAKEGNSMSSIFYGRVMDIHPDILICSEIKNRQPLVEFKRNYEVQYNCPDICLSLDAFDIDYLEIFTGQNSLIEGENDLGDSIVSYEWFLGAMPISNELTVQLTQAELESYGIILPGEYSLGLKVMDEGGLEYYGETSLIITDGEPPISNIITPKGGEAIPYSPDTSNRKTHLIVWEVEENFPPLSRILLSYSTDGGINWTCIADTNNEFCNSNGLEVENTNYLWYLPTKEEAQAQGQTFPTAEGRIKIEVWDGGENKDEDISDENFYIIQPTTTSIQTLIIWNSIRIENSYPGNSETLGEKLSELARHTKINGFVLNLNLVEEIRNAYTNWDGEPTNQTKANLLAEEIRDYILDQINNIFTNARYIIIVGDDKQIPFYRIQDNTSIYAESEYISEVGLNTETTIGSALNQGYFLTDNFYGELEPETTNEFTIYLNDFSVGRLVETPEQMTGVINSYLAADGQVNLKSSTDEVLIKGLQNLEKPFGLFQGKKR